MAELERSGSEWAVMSGPSKSSRTTTALDSGDVTSVACILSYSSALLAYNLSLSCIQRRVRHITSIQVRNLTPFPVRDEFASALTQPSEQSQFTTHGHFSDDLDVTIGRKRGRRRSSTSTINHSVVNGAEAELGSNSVGGTVRKRTLSRTSVASSVGSTPNAKGRAIGPPVVRPGIRPRTISTASSNSHGTMSGLESLHTSISLSGFLKDTSQDALEHIVHSRLVETFLTVSIHTSDDISVVECMSPSLGSPEPGSPASNRTARRNTIVASGSNMSPRTPAPSKRGPISGHPSILRSSGFSSHSKSMSVSTLPSSRTINRPSAPKSLAQRIPASRPSSSSNMPSSSTSRPTTPESTTQVTVPPSPPDYLSPIHRPSTNPSFNVDARRGFDFSPEADLSSSSMSVEVWGKVHTRNGKDKGKGKERAHPIAGHGSTEDAHEWRMLESWDVNLNQLVPLPDDVRPPRAINAFELMSMRAVKLRDHSSRLPSNTLCIKLDPPGRTYYLPPARSTFVVSPPSRSPSPAAGYNSDPETDARKKTEQRTPLKADYQVTWKDGHPKQDESSVLHDLNGLDKKRAPKRSATWQDLLRYDDWSVLHCTAE